MPSFSSRCQVRLFVGRENLVPAFSFMKSGLNTAIEDLKPLGVKSETRFLNVDSISSMNWNTIIAVITSYFPWRCNGRGGVRYGYLGRSIRSWRFLMSSSDSSYPVTSKPRSKSRLPKQIPPPQPKSKHGDGRFVKGLVDTSEDRGPCNTNVISRSCWDGVVIPRASKDIGKLIPLAHVGFSTLPTLIRLLDEMSISSTIQEGTSSKAVTKTLGRFFRVHWRAPPVSLWASTPLSGAAPSTA